MSSSPNKITYCRYPFPPRRLAKQKFAALLQKANRALQDYSAFLKRSPLSQKRISSLMASEAKASLESQNLKPSSKSRLHYLQALKWTCKNPKKIPLSKATVCAIHKKVKRESTPKADLGVYRNRQNWIGPAGCTIDEAYFFPPPADQVEMLMQELFRYAKKKEKEPLLQLALIFAQLLGIHPFMDGNGRVARILIPLFLVQKNLIPAPWLFLSSYFKKHRLKYFQGLYQTTAENKWEDWTAFFLKGIINTVKKIEPRKSSLRGSKKIRKIS
jgi:Fic family protein